MTDTAPHDDPLDAAGGEWGDLAYSAWVIIANAHAGDWNYAHPDWREAAGRWRDKFHAMLAPAVAPPADMAALWAITGKAVPDGAEHRPAAAAGGEPVSPGGPRGEDRKIAPGAAQPPGEFACVQILGHDARTGWVTDGVLAGAACLDVCDDAGRLIAKIPPHTVYLYEPRLPPGALRPRLAIGSGHEPDGSGGYEEEDDYERHPF